METLRLECANCGRDETIAIERPVQWYLCPSCNADTQAIAFPALLKEQQGKLGESLRVEDESSCFFHPGRRAVIPCEGCGRFLCALCDVEIEGRHLCSSCIETGIKKETMTEFRREYTRYDRIALAVAVYPVVIFYFTFVAAPIALFMALWYWRKPVSVLPRSRWRFVVAGLVATLEIAAWLVAILTVFA